MGYPLGYTILSDIILRYNINKRNPKSISFKRYEIKFKTGYPTGWYIYKTIPRDNIFAGYPSGG